MMYWLSTILSTGLCLHTATVRSQAQSASLPDSLPLVLNAIRQNDSLTLNRLVSSHINLQVTDAQGDGVLHYAALYSNGNTLTRLLEAGANPLLQNKLGETALIWAMPDTSKAGPLLRAGANPNAVTNEGNSPLIVASVGNQQEDIIRMLLSYNAGQQVNRVGVTPLMRLSSYGDSAAANLLLSAGASVHTKDKDSLTALFYATKSRNIEMVKWLLDHGANVNVYDRYHAVPLYYAANFNDPAIVELLLAKTTTIDEPDIDGMTLLMWAVYSEYDNPSLITRLLQRGANPAHKAKDGQSVLDWARKKGNTATLALLQQELARQQQK